MSIPLINRLPMGENAIAAVRTERESTKIRNGGGRRWNSARMPDFARIADPASHTEIRTAAIAAHNRDVREDSRGFPALHTATINPTASRTTRAINETFEKIE